MCVRQWQQKWKLKKLEKSPLSLIVLNATLAAGFASLPYGLLVLCLLPISMVLAQKFAVT